MKNLTKLMLASAVMVTSGFATGTTISEDTLMQNGWDITGTDAATIAVGKTVTMQGVDSADSDLNVKDTASLTINGTLAMHDASAIQITSTTDLAFLLNGMLDVQNVSDFSDYSGTVSGANASVVYVPYPNATVTAKASDNVFTLSVDQTSGSEVKVRYKTDDAKLNTNETKVYIKVADERGIYADVAAVTTKTGIAFEDAASNAVLDPIGKSSFTMAEVIADTVNAAANVAKTFDVGQAGLSDRNLNTADDTTIHFGLAGTNAANDVFQYEVGKITIKGDSSEMKGYFGTNGDAEFDGKAANGNMDVQGTLTFGYEGEQTLDGEIKAAAINIPAGSKVVLKNKLTTGWSAMKEIDLSKSTNIRDYAVSSLHRGTIPGIDSTVYYQNKTGTNTNALFYRDASSADPDKLMETWDLSEYAKDWEDYVLVTSLLKVYTLDNWWNCDNGKFGGDNYKGASVNLGGNVVIPASSVHATTFESVEVESPTIGGDYYASKPNIADIKYVALLKGGYNSNIEIYFDMEKKEWLQMTSELSAELEKITEASAFHDDAW